MGFGAILNQNKVSTGGTTYTNEQILNPSDATLIGLNSNALPADMFNVLATAGDLHVWRRTVSSPDGKPEVPAGYTLGVVQNGNFYLSVKDAASADVVWYFSKTANVSPDGEVSIPKVNQTSIDGLQSGGADAIKGKFILTESQNYAGPFSKGVVYFIPSNANIQYNSSPEPSGAVGALVDSYQTVTGYPRQPAIPPGTVTVDYPVSVNPNAYQEGSDAQPAGYTLGAVQSGSFKFTTTSGNYIIAGDGVNVSQDGVVSLSNNTIYTKQSTYTGDNGAQTLQSAVAGKFFYLQNSESEEFNTKEIYYVPSNATVTWNSSSGGFTELSKYQPVTGYPAIPAGTTIEYLGKLGDKGSVGSYVGTGTKGSLSPNKIKFNRRPDVVFVQPTGSGNSVASFMCIVVAGLTSSTSNWNAVSFAKGGGSSVAANGYEIYASYDDATNELSWFCASTRGEQWQQNTAGITYNYVAK